MFAGGSINVTAYSDALVVLGTAGVLVPLFRRWGVNPVLGYLSAGALLGPLGLGTLSSHFHPLYWLTISNAESISGIAELGVVFLMFMIGLELSFPRLARMGRLIGGLGGLQVLLSSILFALGLRAVGLPLQSSILLAVALSLSSTAVVMEILSRQRRVATRTGKAVFAVLLAQDLAALPILLFVSISSASRGGSMLSSLLDALLQAMIAVAAIFVLGRLLMHPLFRQVASARSAELFIATVLFVVIGSSLLAHAAGLSMAMGAFLAGLLLAETEFQKAIQGSIEPFKGLLLGVFFFTVGMRVDLRELWRSPLILAASIAALIAVKALVVAGLARIFRFSWSTTIETALLLGPGGEFAFVILGLATDLRLIDSRLAGFALAAVTVSMAATPALAALAMRIRKALNDRRPLDPEFAIRPPEEGQSRAIVVGYGRVGKMVCSLFSRAGIPFLATDMNPQVVVTARNDGNEVYFGNPADPEFLRACGLMEASGIVITIDEPEVIDRAVEFARFLRPSIPIIARARDAGHARQLFSLGASEAVPETVESSLQLAEAAIVGLGFSQSQAESCVHTKRMELRGQFRASLRKGGPEEQNNPVS